MIVRLVEIFETTGRSTNAENSYSLREVYINADHVVCMREDAKTKNKLISGMLPQDLNPNQEFTKIFINRGSWGSDLVVVGAPEVVQEKLKGKKVLQG